MLYTLLQIFGPILLMIITFFYQYKIDHSQKSDEKRRKYAKNGYIISAFALIITAFSQFEDWQDTNETNENLNNQLTSLNKLYQITSDSLKLTYSITSDSLKDEILLLQDSVKLQGNKIISLYGNIFDKTNFIQNSLYGDGYAYFWKNASIVDSNGATWTSFNIQNVSNFPLYNVNLQIFNYKCLDRNITENKYSNTFSIWASDFKDCIAFTIGPFDLNPKQLYQTPFLLETQFLEYGVGVLTTRNGIFYEKMLHWYDMDQNKSIFDAFQLFDGNLKLLHEGVPQYLYPMEDLLYKKLAEIDIEKFRRIYIVDEEIYP